MNKKDFDYLAKIVIIGDSSVGKTALMIRSCDDRFNPSFVSTIGVDFRHYTIVVDGKSVKMQMWDTAGQERFRTVTSTFYKHTDVVLIVYDVNNRQTFDHAYDWMKECNKHNEKKYITFLIANKCDGPCRQVLKEEGEAFAKKHNIQYFETSARSGEGVHDAFAQIARMITVSISPRSAIRTVNPSNKPAQQTSFFSRCSVL